jgi:hypothetical protein
MDGRNWIGHAAVPRTGFLTPTNIGFYINSTGGFGSTWLSWQVTLG